MPFGQVPVLEVDGKLMAQSHTISRFLARRYGLAGKSEWEKSFADMYVDCIYDLQGGNSIYFPIYSISNEIKSFNCLKTEMGSATWESDPIKQQEMFNKIITQKILPHLKKIEEQLVQNGSGYLVGQSVR